MAFPIVQSSDTKSGVVSSDSAAWNLDYPTNLSNGDLVLALIAVDESPIDTLPANWVDLDVANGSVKITAAKYKSNGTETGNFAVTFDTAQQGCWRTLRISEWEGTLGSAFTGAVDFDGATNGVGNIPNPGTIDPTDWGTEDTLWIAACAANGGDTTVTGFPTDYTNTASQNSGGADGACLGLAFRELNTSTENPGIFTISVSTEWVTIVIAIRPGTSGGGAFHFLENGSIHPLNKWFRLEWHIVHNSSTGLLELRYFSNADLTTPTDKVLATNIPTGSSVEKVRMGAGGGSPSDTYWIADIVVGAIDWVGPTNEPSFYPGLKSGRASGW